MNILITLAALSVAILIPAILAIASKRFAPAGVDVINTAGTHEDAVTRFPEVDIAKPHLRVKKGSSANQIVVAGAADRATGTVADAADAGQAVGVYLLGGSNTRLFVANGAIPIDARVYSAADGKVSATFTSGAFFHGYSLTATTADGEEIEVDTVKAQAVAPTIRVATADAAISALETLNPGLVVSNAGAAGAVTFALPAAVPGMRIDAVVEAAQQLRLDPNGTETIALPSTGVQSAAGKYIWADAIGENVSLVCITAGTWDVLGYAGTWTAEV